jgi:hypothetical protein
VTTDRHALLPPESIVIPTTSRPLGARLRTLVLSASLLAFVALAPLAQAGPQPAATPSTGEIAAIGNWKLGLDDRGDFVWMSFEQGSELSGHHHVTGGRVPLAQLHGLGPDDLGAASVSVEFDVVRQAGTLHCTGHLHSGKGAGDFEARLDADFARRLERRGVGRPSPDQQVRLLMADVDESLLDDLKADKYPTPSIDQLVRLSEHGVDRAFVNGLAERGYRLDSVEELVQARDHGVDPNYLDELAKSGYRSVEFELALRARDHGVDAEFLGDLADVGYPRPALEEAIRVRDHGVDGWYAEQMAKAGFGKLSLSELVRAKDHGVTPGFARRMREHQPDITIDEVIQARDRGGRD